MSDINIEISTTATVRSGKTKDGRDYEITEQQGWLFIPGLKYPLQVMVTSPSLSESHPIGKYKVDLAQSIKVNRFQQIEFARNLVLTPLESKASQLGNLKTA